MAGNQKFPPDLLFIVGLVILTNIFILVSPFNESFIRTILGLFLLIFLPGYAFISALFPEEAGLEGMERIALSVGLSVAIVPLIGLVINFTPWGIREIPLLISLSAFTLLMSGVAYSRRRKLPENRIFGVSLRSSALTLLTKIVEKSESKTEKILRTFLAISFLVLIVTLAYVTLTPHEREPFTELYILGQKGMAENYTTEYVQGESGTYIIGIVNNEYKTMNYTMEVRLENESLPFQKNLKNIRLAHNTTMKEPLKITPFIEGKNQKLEFLLFNETEKKVPYKNLCLWINVSKSV